MDAKFGWNCPCDSKEQFWDVINVFSLFRSYLNLKKGVAVHLNKTEISVT